MEVQGGLIANLSNREVQLTHENGELMVENIDLGHALQSQNVAMANLQQHINYLANGFMDL